MPTQLIDKYSERSGKSKQEVERLWDKAKGVVDSQYKDVDKESDDYWKLTMGIFKNMLGLDEEAPSTTTSTMGNYVHKKKLMWGDRDEKD